MIVAIDGPAGVGKSTLARALAQTHGFSYLDTGAMYRAIGLACIEHPGEQPGALAQRVHIELGERVLLDGRDVTEAIREPDVADAASRAAADPHVREALVRMQREIVANGDWVAEGRDIGTVVAPGAQLKIFLTASDEDRARRRALELGLPATEVLQQQRERDARDSGREHSPLVAAADAVELDSTGLTQAEVLARAGQLLEQRR